jgi:hypothetical protein
MILLNKIYKEYFGKESEIICAPSWKLIDKYGGYLTIEQFREKMNKVVFIENGNLLQPIL